MDSIQKGRKTLSMLLLTLSISMSAFAQDDGTDINVDTNKGGNAAWYTSPWVWIIGSAVFILLLVALLRGNGARD
jgi:hypothetical protein